MRWMVQLVMLLLSMNGCARGERLVIPLQNLCELRRESETIGEKIATWDIAQGKLRARVLKDVIFPPNEAEMRILEIEAAMLRDMGIEVSIREQSDDSCGEGQIGGYYRAMGAELERRFGPKFREVMVRKALERYREQVKSPMDCRQYGEQAFCRTPRPNRSLNRTHNDMPPSGLISFWPSSVLPSRAG